MNHTTRAWTWAALGLGFTLGFGAALFWLRDGRHVEAGQPERSASPRVVQSSESAQPKPRNTLPPKPNIVFMMADNLGYGEPGCYGGGILRGAATPRID